MTAVRDLGRLHDIASILIHISVIGLVIYPFETRSVRRFLPGYFFLITDGGFPCLKPTSPILVL